MKTCGVMWIMISRALNLNRLAVTALVVVTAVTASAGWFAWYWFLSEDMQSVRAHQRYLEENPNFHHPANPPISISHAHAATDLSDDRKLSGFVQNIFIGKVLEKSGQTEERGWPETQFKVRVLDVLKGELEGEIIVNQQGGIREADGSIYRREGDLELLQTGRAYLFATRTFPEKNWHTVMPGYGDIKIEADDLGDDGKLLKSERAKELRARFKEAIENEIPYEPTKR